MVNLYEDHKKEQDRQMDEFKSLLENTFGGNTLTLRQQADRNTAAMVARGIDTTTTTPSESTSNPETFTDTTESGLEMSEDTNMIVDNNEKDKSLLIDGLEDTIPKNQKQKVVVNAEIKTANHCVGPSGAVISSGVATVDVEMVDVETDQESTDEHNNASINLDTSELKELEGLETEGEIDQETLNLKLLDKS